MKAASPASAKGNQWSRIFSGVFGAFLGLALLKFGNPPIMEKWVDKPVGIYEIVLAYPWPILWAYSLLGFVTLCGLLVVRWKTNAAGWLVALPVAWLVWDVGSVPQSVDIHLALATVTHILACVVCFYLGLFALERERDPGPFWAALLCGFALVLVGGWEQHFGGLEETRQYFFVNASQLSDRNIKGLSTLAARLPKGADPVSSFLWAQFDAAGREAVLKLSPWPESRQQAMAALVRNLNTAITNQSIYAADRFRDVQLRTETQRLIAANPRDAEVYRLNRLLLEDAYPDDVTRMPEIAPDLLKRMSSKRIFSTLLYPNTLAGCVLLLLPPMLAVIWGARERFTIGSRRFLVAVIGIGALGCLYWSGSKGGWLLMLLLGLVALLELPLAKKLKFALIIIACLAGLSGFFWKYASFFERGATSVSARLDYWRAAVQIAAARPLFGTGPGTFLIPYEKLKRPESESARLVHNDYLEQASDSGLVAAVVYALFIGATLVRTFPRRSKPETKGAKSRTNAGQQQYPARDWVAYSVWLGTLGWSLQGLFEFGLYIPALAWTAFAFFGWLLGRNPGTAG